MGHWGRLKLVVGFISAIAITSNGLTTSVRAAQTVELRLESLNEPIPVADLRTFAQTGTVPKRLQPYSKLLSAEQRSKVIAALRTTVPLKIVTISNLLNTQIGSTLLGDLATVTPRQDKREVPNLRAGLVLGAAAPRGLSILSFIEAYPGQSIAIDLKQAFIVAANLNTSFWRTQQFMAAIAPRLAPERTQLNLPFDPTQPGGAAVQVIKLNLQDQKRQRLIPVDIYWSTAATRAKPVIVFSHGLGSLRTDMRYLAEHLASYGYVVAALEHPGSNEAHTKLAADGKGPLLEPQEFLERPKDISFVLDELEKLGKTPTNPLGGKLARNRAMVIGYSFGGATALSIVGAEMQLERLKQRCTSNLISFSLGEGIQCVAKGLPENRYQLRDPRVLRAIALNPTTSLLFGETGLSKVQVPTLVEAGSADKTTPALTEQIIGFDKIPAPKWLVGIVGATHLSIKDPSTTLDQAQKPLTLYSGGEVVGEQAVDVRKYIKAIALAMAAQLTSDADKYAVFLTPEYAQFASTEAFPIRLVTQIPPDALAIAKDYLRESLKSQ